MNHQQSILTTERLEMRQITEADLENVFIGLSDPEITKYYGVSYDSIEATKSQMQWYAELIANKTGIWWAIRSIISGKFIGAAGFNDLDHTHKKAEIGFWLYKDYWGQGFTLEAVICIIEFAFHTLKLHRIEAFVEPENIACKKVMDKLNFGYEGTMKDCEVKNDQFISLDLYALISTKS